MCLMFITASLNGLSIFLGEPRCHDLQRPSGIHVSLLFGRNPQVHVAVFRVESITQCWLQVLPSSMER
jgi:hypothetical protein